MFLITNDSRPNISAWIDFILGNEGEGMAKMIDLCPTKHGEAKVWNLMKSYLPDDIVVYSNREINGREFDDCLFVENWGIIIIEVKGWLADKIKVYGVDQIKVEGYKELQGSPKKQARAYRFELLDKIKEKYNRSPLVFDLVCYPFISEQEYRETRLNIISEEKVTIFKEDLETQERFQKKLHEAYKVYKAIPHAEFSHDFMLKLRQEWEPDCEDPYCSTVKEKNMYSLLTIYPDPVSEPQIAEIADDYFQGIKRIVFFGDKQSYTSATEYMQEAFKKHNIEPFKNNVSIGFKQGLTVGSQSTRAFNLELYCVEDLQNIVGETVTVEEGKTDDFSFNCLKKLEDTTTFNFQQYQVEHASPECNSLVEAGAGTGKTFSMVSRVAFLCNRKASEISSLPDDLAMVTFTNDAANNMRVRLKQMFLNYFVLTGNLRYLKFTEEIERAHISTIHSFALDILRDKSLYTGLGTNFHISSDEFGRKKIYDFYMGEFLRQKEEENPNFGRELAVPVYELKSKIIQIADRLLNQSVDLNNIEPGQLGSSAENVMPYFNDLLLKVVFPAEREYLKQMHDINGVDLKESIILLNHVLSQIPGKLDDLKIKYLFIDEFQDTDDVQIQVFQKLQRAMNSVCKLFVVGDLKQSIYRFRGANLSAFKQLQENSLLAWETFHLRRNYRTDSRLLKCFEPIFSNMGSNRYLPYSEDDDKLTSNLLTEVSEDNLMKVVPYHGKDRDRFKETFLTVLQEQIDTVNHLIHQKKWNKAERTIAILVRSNWQVEQIIRIAKEAGIQIETHSGGDLYQLPSTLDLYKLLLALNNSENPLYLINLLESNYVKMHLDYQNLAGMREDAQTEVITDVLDQFLKLRMGKTWREVVDDTYTKPILYVVKKLYDALAPWKHYSMAVEEQMHYMANYEYLLELILQFFKQSTPSLNQLTEYLTINITTGQKRPSRDVGVDEQGVRILCTTVHKSKGLEYGTVILPFTDDDIGDLRRVKIDASYVKNKLAYTVQFENKVREYNTNYNANYESDEQIAEESRILYVALTRAIRSCVWIKDLDRNPSISWGSMMEV